MHRLNMGYQLGVNPNRVQVCDGRADDDEEDETYWGVRNNENPKSADLEAPVSHDCRKLVLRGIRLGFHHRSRTLQCNTARQVGGQNDSEGGRRGPPCAGDEE